MMQLLASVAFGLLALERLSYCVLMHRARGSVRAALTPEMRDQGMRALRGGIIAAGSTALLFSVACALVWSNPAAGLAIGALPFLVFGVLFATGNVDVISRRCA